MSFFRLCSALLILTIGSQLLGCDYSNSMQTPMKQGNKVEFNLRESGDTFKSRYSELVKALRQPVGVTFYNVQWPSGKKGAVKINAGSTTLEVDNVLHLSAAQDEAFQNEGIATINVISGISGPNGISHLGARDYLFSALAKLRKAGWAPTIPFGAPRLRGREMLMYKAESGKFTTLDADYVPTLDEWLQLEDLTIWELHGDRAFLKVSFKRQSKSGDPAGLDIYLITYELTSDVNYFRGFVDPLHRGEWKTLLQAELDELAVKRKNIERQLSIRGVHIDTGYKDPVAPE